MTTTGNDIHETHYERLPVDGSFFLHFKCRRAGRRNDSATGSAEVFFSPDGGATAAIVREIDAAKSEVLVQAYSFTSVPIAQALLNAKKEA